MTIEYLPVGIACNISCKYCYQDPMRDAGNINVPRDWEKVQRTLSSFDQDFAVFGGEPLLAPISHLEEVFEFGFRRFGKNGIQTNGSLITEDHIKLFQTYNVGVGISIDGPGDLNSVRCANDFTEKSLWAIQRLCDLGRPPSIICTVHKGNGGREELIQWLDGLYKIGVKHYNFHELEVECGREELALDPFDNAAAFLRIYEWSLDKEGHFNPFSDMKSMLTREDAAVMCVWNACDPLTTPAVQGVNPDGSRSNCGRTNKDGINWLKSDSAGMERYIALYHTPQEYGGCKGCQYFAFCRGHCPGTAIDGDWRNRTSNCLFWYTLFERIAEDNKDHLVSPTFIRTRELMVLGEHGDTPHGDAHGDKPHGDSHGDHTDLGIEAIILKEKPSWL